MVEAMGDLFLSTTSQICKDCYELFTSFSIFLLLPPLRLKKTSKI